MDIERIRQVVNASLAHQKVWNGCTLYLLPSRESTLPPSKFVFPMQHLKFTKLERSAVALKIKEGCSTQEMRVRI